MKIFENEHVEIFCHEGAGYEPTMHYQGWRVALLRYAPHFGKIGYRERHLLTDEVFVLLAGDAKLYLGREMTELALEPKKLYNVKKACWHALAMTEDATVLVVENHNTGGENSEKHILDAPFLPKWA